MAALSNSESRPQYSWWWDSHNIPQNSKWIQENLKEMDGKVKTMIKLIEEDADSFARRAEMYYKKRPELMKLVEDFYRAYRALAERYNHVTGELRHAQRTIAKAFPNQVPPELLEDLPSKFLSQDRGTHTSELKGPTRTLCESDDDSQSLSPSDIKNLSGFKGENRVKETELSKENENLRKKILHESERAEKYESEVFDLKKKLDDMQSDKENVLVYYQQCLQKLAKIERELDNAKLDSVGLTEKANQAETESQTLKETLFQLEVEKNTRLVKLNEYLDKISNLEDMLCRAEEEMRGLDKRAVQAESEAQSVKTEISRLELEKEEVILQYKSHLGKISELEKTISLMEDEATLLKKRAEKSETEVCDLKRALADLNKEKEASSLQYQSYLEKILILENDLFLSEQDVSRLNKQVLTGNSKLKSAEEKCSILETTNKSLRVEANNISKLIAMKDLEIHEKQEELEKLHTCLKNKHLHHAQIEATLKTLQNSHVQAQEDQKALSMELQALLQNLKDLELSKKGLEEENQMLSQTNLSSLASMDNMLKEILSLCEIKERHEKQISYQMGLSESLQNEILCLKEEIQRLNLSYHALFQQAEDNSKLKQICEDGSSEKAILLKKLVDLEKTMEEKVITESSFSSMISELGNSQERFKAVQESCHVLNGEKTATLSQLQAVTQNMHKLLERNAIIENSLLKAKVEVEGLREKSNGLEDICELLKNERLHLLSERGNLALELESVEKRLESLEKRCIGLEEKYADVEKEKNVIHTQIKELEISLTRGKEEKSRSRFERETRLTGLENEIQLLKEENKWKEKESEEELEKALKSQFEKSILQKFIKEMEEKNYSLIIECQKHVEASNLADKLIFELESESFEQQVESGRLLDEIERLRLAIYNVFRSLENGVDFSQCENEGAFVNHMLGIIENMKFSVARNEDDKQLLLVQNSVLLTMLEQFESKGIETESQKVYLEKELNNVSEELFEVKIERDKLADMNRRLRYDVIDGHKLAATFEAELRDLCSKQDDLRKCYNVLQEMYTQVNRDKKSLLKKCSDLNEDKILEDQVYEAILVEFLATNNELTVVKNFGDEKVKELKSLSDDLIKQHELNCVFEREIRVLKGKMELQKAENMVLKDSVLDLENKIQDIKESNKLVLFETNLTLEAAENLNSILCGTVDELKMETQDSLKIRENLEKSMLRLNKSNSSYKNEVGRLRIVNTNLSSEIGLLREEIIEQIASEQSLSLELDGKNHEFEMLEAEGSAFYFHLQISSSVREVLFENKVKELIGVCKALENERVSKNLEIEQMKGKFSSMEREINGLRSQMSAYCPVVACLEEDISLFERNSIFQTTRTALNQEAQILESTSHPTNCEMFPDDQTLLSLMKLQAQVRAVAKKMQGTNLSDSRRRSNSATKQESSLSEIESSKLGRTFSKNKHDKCRKKGMLMKDIPLDQVSGEFQKRGNTVKEDQMLDDGMMIGESLRRSFKTTETDIVYDHLANMKHKSSPPSTDSDIEKEFAVILGSQLNEGANDRKIFDRLKSDAQKLETLQITVPNLMSKLEMNRKGKNSESVDFETVSEQLLEAEETVLHLLNLNGELVKDIEQCPSPNSRASVQLKEAVMTKRRKVMEQARKGSERIGRLELEIKKIECMLLTDDKKNKARNKFFKNKTIILRDFIYNGRKKNGKRKNDSLCRCFKSSTCRNGSISP